ncbi:MAG: PAS domain S-box protein [Proteobacteria bacterium]|nr:PAS domain S-box protein [Pseudomonadota bacterium]
MSLPDNTKRRKFSNWSLLVCIIVGGLIAIGTAHTLNLPSKIAKGLKAQKVIQMLDAMRRPFLMIKDAEIELIKTGDVGLASENFARAIKSADTLLDKYLQLSQYNAEVSKRVKGLKEEYGKWMVEERHLFEHYSEILLHGDEIVLKEHFIAKLSKASSCFMDTMNRLGDGEVPIHNDMDVGSEATRLLMVLSGFFFLYLIGLMFFYQSVKKREISQSYDQLKKEAEERKRTKEGLRKSEERYRKLFHSSTDAIIIHDLEGNMLDANEEALELFGYNESEMKLLTAHDIQPSYAYSPTAKSCEELALAGNVHYEVAYKKKNGEIFKAEVSVGRFEVEGKEVIQGIIRDITDRKKAEENLEKAKQKAEAASRAKSEFLANMSHEIRTPMTSIIGMAELLSETKLNEEQMEFVDRLIKSGDSLVRIINDILDLSKVEAGLIEVEEINFSLAGEIEKVLSIFEVKAVKKGIKLKKVISPHVPDYLLSDPVRLRQVLVNLVGNALKFTESGKITISAEYEEPSDCVETCNLLFSVRDTGIGIPEHKRDAIFAEFSQGDSSTTRTHGGTGLGLAISRKLVELMGGRLEVKSKGGEGSTFYFTLNMKIGFHEKEPDRESTVSLTISKEQPLNILLAEDAEDNRLLVKAFLKDTSHKLDMAKNGEEAVEMFTAGEYDLVLMDMQMPVMDGYTATRVIRGWENRNERKAIPVIAFTAHALKEEAEKCLEAGCTAHLSKPIKKQDLIKTVQSYSLTNS